MAEHHWVVTGREAAKIERRPISSHLEANLSRGLCRAIHARYNLYLYLCAERYVLIQFGPHSGRRITTDWMIVFKFRHNFFYASGIKR